jgi:hypothetical protein
MKNKSKQTKSQMHPGEVRKKKLMQRGLNYKKESIGTMMN